MQLKFLFFIPVYVIFLSIISCGGSKAASTITPKSDTVKKARTVTQHFTYRFHLNAPASMINPHDEILIDTNGQMTFDTEQHLKNGKWKRPRGYAYLEPKDEDTLLSFIKQDILFTIEESDVSPQCPDGDSFTLQIKRSDIPKPLSIATNTCAGEFNLLTGEKRKIFPPFIAFIERLRTRYRPQFVD